MARACVASTPLNLSYDLDPVEVGWDRWKQVEDVHVFHSLDGMIADGFRFGKQQSRCRTVRDDPAGVAWMERNVE